MIKINAKFSAKKDVRGYHLHHTTPPGMFRGKLGQNDSVDITYYPNFAALCR